MPEGQDEKRGGATFPGATAAKAVLRPEDAGQTTPMRTPREQPLPVSGGRGASLQNRPGSRGEKTPDLRTRRGARGNFAPSFSAAAAEETPRRYAGPAPSAAGGRRSEPGKDVFITRKDRDQKA